MGLPRSQFNLILNIIDQRRLKNQQVHQERKDTLYKTMPRLHEIDVLISTKTMAMTRRILENPTNRATILTSLREEVGLLSNQKKQLLESGGYDADYLAQARYIAN